MKKKQTKNKLDTEPAARLIAGLFILGLAGIILFGMPTLLTGWFISRFVVGFAVILNFIPKRLYPFIYRVKPKLRFLLNIAGFAPMATTLLLALNYFIAIDTYDNSYKVRHTIYFDYDDQFELVLDDDALSSHDQIRRFNKRDYIGIHDSVTYTIAKGVFGMPVVKESRVILKYDD